MVEIHPENFHLSVSSKEEKERKMKRFAEAMERWSDTLMEGEKRAHLVPLCGTGAAGSPACGGTSPR